MLSLFDWLTAFIKNKVVTQAHIDSFHFQPLQVIKDRIQHFMEPLQEHREVLQVRFESLGSNVQIGSEGAGGRAVSERPRGSDPAFRAIVCKGIPEDLSATQRLQDIDNFMKSKCPKVKISDI